jgi:hypothetical protein
VIPIVYLEQAGAAPIALWRYLLFAATGVVVLVKPLLYEERSWTTLMFGLYILTIIVSAASIHH